MEAEVGSYLEAAVLHRELQERLRHVRSQLMRARWWPIPERRPLLDENAHLITSLTDLSSVLDDEALAERVCSTLVRDAVDEVRRAPDAPDDDERLVERVTELLARPGRPPLPASCPVGLSALPALAEALTDAGVRTVVQELPSTR